MGSEWGGVEVCSQESVTSCYGGTDLWGCSLVGGSDSSPPSSADHLVVMVHGILGSTANWKFAAGQFVRMLPDKVIVHCSESNLHKLTLDGVDVMGERLANEVIEVVKRRPEVKRISFIAHSVGGLVARYAIGRLYRPPTEKNEDNASDQIYRENSEGTIIGLEAMNFITIASPHLGSRGNKQVPFLLGVAAMEKVASHVVHWIFGRTGKHLFLVDNDGGEPPLLLRMVNDSQDLYFMSALQAFRRRVAYANVSCDHIVGWGTSSIRRNWELPKWVECLRETYPHVVYEESTKGNITDNSADLEGDYDDLEEKMVAGLTSLSWERVDVNFYNSSQWFDAHNVIQVKDFYLHSEGADVIQHMLDHFAT